MSNRLAQITIDPEFPPKLQCLFQPKRHKVLWGGRGAGRSWGVARAILIQGMNRPLRVLCVRELQNSIAESVHKLLADQITELGLEGFYQIEKAKIYGSNGTEISFEGVKNNHRKIKSYEGIDLAWVEEANNVSAASWEVLIPTIRKDDSEIWITFNPELKTDYTYRRFVLNPSADSAVVHMTYRDNPWFPKVLEAERDDLRDRDYDAYLNVWEGQCRETLEGAIYAKELRRAQADGRITTVPWVPEIPVDTFWDLGRADHTSIWFGQKVGTQYRVLAYFQDNLEDISYYIRHLQSRRFVYGTHWLPHDARAKVLGSKRSVEETVRASYPGMVRIALKCAVTDGINAGRLIFDNCWFDEKQCETGLECLRHYKYEVTDGQIGNKPLHDWASDGADAFRTMAVSIKLTGKKPATVRDRLAAMVYKNPIIDDHPGLGWLR